jgi:hypothetical protein
VQGIAGSMIGAFLGMYLSKPIISATRYGGI